MKTLNIITISLVLTLFIAGISSTAHADGVKRTTTTTTTVKEDKQVVEEFITSTSGQRNYAPQSYNNVQQSPLAQLLGALIVSQVPKVCRTPITNCVAPSITYSSVGTPCYCTVSNQQTGYSVTAHGFVFSNF